MRLKSLLLAGLLTLSILSMAQAQPPPVTENETNFKHIPTIPKNINGGDRAFELRIGTADFAAYDGDPEVVLDATTTTIRLIYGTVQNALRVVAERGGIEFEVGILVQGFPRTTPFLMFDDFGTSVSVATQLEIGGGRWELLDEIVEKENE